MLSNRRTIEILIGSAVNYLWEHNVNHLKVRMYGYIFFFEKDSETEIISVKYDKECSQ